MDPKQIIRANSMATHSGHKLMTIIDDDLVTRKCADAEANFRHREIHYFHTGDSDTLHRMLNIMQPGSYIRPHRHYDPPKGESIFILRGLLGVVLFGLDGSVADDDYVLLDARRGVYGVDIRAEAWHTIMALSPDTVIFEAKPGPYVRATDKGWPDWAPAPDAPEAPAYCMDLEDRLRARFGLDPRPWGLDQYVG